MPKPIATTQIGGKGSIRRVITRAPGTSAGITQDQNLVQVLKSLKTQKSNPIEEVNMFHKNGTILHFEAPPIHANTETKCFAILAKGQIKRFHELIPGILTQMDFNDLDSLRARSEELQGLKQDVNGTTSAGAEDEDIPDLVESFEDVDV